VGGYLVSHVDLSALISTMNYQRHLSGWIVFEFLIIIVAFGLGIALKAKEASAWEDLGTIDPSLAPYDNVLDFINFYLFTVTFAFVSILALMLVTVVSEIIYTSVWLIVHFLNFGFFLISFIFFVTSDIGKSATCDAVKGTELDTPFCKLPKACEGLSAVCWIILLLGLFGRWWAARKYASGKDARLALYPAMTERKSKAPAETTPTTV